VGDELAEERPHRDNMGVGVAGDVSAKVAGSTRTAEHVQRSLTHAERGHVFEQRAIAPAGERCVDASGRQAVIAGDARGVPARRCTGLGFARTVMSFLSVVEAHDVRRVPVATGTEQRPRL
jgi:hypothetical protein